MAAIIATMAGAGRPARAQTNAGRPIKLVVGFAPSSGPDQVARVLSPRLGEALGQPVVIDNRAGAGGQIAAAVVAKSAPDGLTLLLGEVGSISIAPAAYSKLPYDPVRDLVPVVEVVKSDFVLVCPTSAPFRTINEMVDHARRQGARGFNFATFGAGTPGHFGAEALAREAGFKIEAVHYRTPADAVTALVAGDVQALLASTALAAAQVKGGRARAIGTTASARLDLLPEVPTFAEAGFPNLNFTSWFTVFAPAGTGQPQLDLWNRQIVATLHLPEVRKQLAEAGFTVTGPSRPDTEKLVQFEAARWASIVRASGFKSD